MQARGGGACMRGIKNERKQSVNPTQNDGDEVGDGGKGVRRGRPLAKTLGGRAHSSQ